MWRSRQSNNRRAIARTSLAVDFEDFNYCVGVVEAYDASLETISSFVEACVDNVFCLGNDLVTIAFLKHRGAFRQRICRARRIDNDPPALSDRTDLKTISLYSIRSAIFDASSWLSLVIPSCAYNTYVATESENHDALWDVTGVWADVGGARKTAARSNDRLLEKHW